MIVLFFILIAVENRLRAGLANTPCKQIQPLSGIKHGPRVRGNQYSRTGKGPTMEEMIFMTSNRDYQHGHYSAWLNVSALYFRV